jgi:hypothetical protein
MLTPHPQRLPPSITQQDRNRIVVESHEAKRDNTKDNYSTQEAKFQVLAAVRQRRDALFSTQGRSSTCSAGIPHGHQPKAHGTHRGVRAVAAKLSARARCQAQQLFTLGRLGVALSAMLQYTQLCPAPAIY